MDLGNFSVSLAVKDLAASRAFYEKLGLRVAQGEASQGWLIMKGPGYAVGLFQGMFDKNILTFNPGWDAEARPLKTFMDVRRFNGGSRQRGSSLSTRRTKRRQDPPAAWSSIRTVIPSSSISTFKQWSGVRRGSRRGDRTLPGR